MLIGAKGMDIGVCVGEVRHCGFAFSALGRRKDLAASCLAEDAGVGREIEKGSRWVDRGIEKGRRWVSNDCWERKISRRRCFCEKWKLETDECQGLQLPNEWNHRFDEHSRDKPFLPQTTGRLMVST